MREYLAEEIALNDTGPRYNAAAASEAYQAVLSWFATHLA
jgi:dienelactone hydrolase